MTKRRKCQFEGCDNDEDYAILGVCRTCYSGLTYWRGRPQADKQRRARQLTKLASRMEHLIEKPRQVPHRKKKKAASKRKSKPKGNVVPINRSRAPAPRSRSHRHAQGAR